MNNESLEDLEERIDELEIKTSKLKSELHFLTGCLLFGFGLIISLYW